MNLSEFPTLDLGLTGKHRERVEAAFALLSDGLAGGEIPNVRYEDTVKYNLNNIAVGTIWKALVGSRVRYDRDIRNYTFDGVAFAETDKAAEKVLGYVGMSGPDAHLVPGKLAKIEAFIEKSGTTPYIDAVREALAEFAPIATAIKDVKDKGRVVKRQPKPPEDLVAKYNAPAASTRAIGRVRDILIGITQEAYDGLLAHLLRRTANLVDGYISLTAQMYEINPTGEKPKEEEVRQTLRKLRQTRENLFQGMRELHEAVEPIIADQQENYNGYHAVLVSRSAKFHELVRKVATRDADQIRYEFIYKNLVKLDSVLELKGDFKAIEKISHHIALDALEGTLRLTFEDGASFIVRNSVKWVVNQYGTAFRQFPLTFHDVVLSDGTRMRVPSEEKMNTEFVGKAD